MKLKKILLAVDGSDHARKAVKYAVGLARLMEGELLVVHVHRPLPIASSEPYFQMASAQMRDRVNRLLDPVFSLLKESRVPFVEKIEEGRPGEVIAKVAELDNCDVIVMGSRGRSDLEGLVLGSATHRVLRTAPCPVIVVR